MNINLKNFFRRAKLYTAISVTLLSTNAAISAPALADIYTNFSGNTCRAQAGFNASNLSQYKLEVANEFYNGIIGVICPITKSEKDADPSRTSTYLSVQYHNFSLTGITLNCHSTATDYYGNLIDQKNIQPIVPVGRGYISMTLKKGDVYGLMCNLPKGIGIVSYSIAY
ncbi:hypothetical protein H6G97_41695 [Nostoc flagelliforme FACHB-838]|uniref:Uncharacterized protein n=1 Tax=Nostoc flagelliforme FACHB-838 TaxID=2692904 RepID=A0ABR8E391_9NOSO|nr:hypothetical protein [Nostoc flagelliforme]MBD2535557.1 hypothetical protein [Nostoc flagelliforme FACHB-838]